MAHNISPIDEERNINVKNKPDFQTHFPAKCYSLISSSLHKMNFFVKHSLVLTINLNWNPFANGGRNWIRDDAEVGSHVISGNLRDVEKFAFILENWMMEENEKKRNASEDETQHMKDVTFFSWETTSLQKHEARESFTELISSMKLWWKDTFQFLFFVSIERSRRAFDTTLNTCRSLHFDTRFTMKFFLTRLLLSSKSCQV